MGKRGGSKKKCLLPTGKNLRKFRLFFKKRLLPRQKGFGILSSKRADYMGKSSVSYGRGSTRMEGEKGKQSGETQKEGEG